MWEAQLEDEASTSNAIRADELSVDVVPDAALGITEDLRPAALIRKVTVNQHQECIILDPVGSEGVDQGC